jgi:spoIIIJ-associated protein
MDNFVEKTGKTVQEAVESALEELNADEDEVEIEVLDEGSKGLLGLLGSKQAKVRVTLRENRGELAYAFLKDVFEKMNINADVTIREDSDAVQINITGEDSGIIIGRRGETLDALQYLTSLVVNKETQEYKKVSLDIENYRQKREETLVNLANRLARKVIKYKKSITLEPMNPYERKIIHSTLQENSSIETYSLGDEPNRKVIIRFRH